ncbi:MAG: universal stress protein [Planctomycetota bacterium]
MQRLLACIDASLYATSVADHAAWAARRLDAAVELLHVIQRNDAVTARQDLSGAVGLGAKSSLLEELVAIDEAEAKLSKERGRLLLEAAEERVRAGGVQDVRTVHRHGGIVETVVEREENADLVVIGKRGASSGFARDHIGSKVERVVRESIRPVLVTTPEFRPIERVLVAYDGGRSAERAVELAARSPLLEGTDVHVLTVGRSSADRQRDLDAVAARLPQATCDLVPGEPEEVLAREIESRGADLLLMGAYGHSPLRRLIVGSLTTAMMQRCRVPVLLFR